MEEKILTLLTVIIIICGLGILTLIITYIWFDWNDIMSKLLKTFLLLGIISFIIMGVICNKNDDWEHDDPNNY